MFPDGSFVVVWTSEGQDGSDHGVFGQRFDTNGSPIGPEFQVNSYTLNLQADPSVSTAADGSFVVVWESDGQDGDSFGVFGQRFDATGIPVGAEFQANTYTQGWQLVPAVSAAPTGSFVVAWSSEGQDGDLFGVFGQRFDAGGNPVGTEFQINTYTQNWQARPSVSTASDGSFVVVWQSNEQDGDWYGVFGQRYDAAGSPVGGEFQVNSYTAGYQGVHSISTASDGRFVVVWESAGQAESVFGQRYDASGNPVGPEFQVNVCSVSFQGHPAVSLAPDGTFVVVWDSEPDQDGFWYGVFAQRFNSAGEPRGVLPW